MNQHSDFDTLDDEALRCRNTHFHQRCRERGITESDTAELFEWLCWAIQSGRDDLAQPCLSYKGNTFYRFRCPEGIFYAVCKDHVREPATVMNQEMFRSTRKRVKGYRKFARSHRKMRKGGA